MTERDDLHELIAEGAIEEGVSQGAGDADMFTRKIDCLIVLDGEIVVVDAVDGEGELGWRRWFRGVFVSYEFLLLIGSRGDLCDKGGLQALDRRLNCTLIDVAAYPAPSKALCDLFLFLKKAGRFDRWTEVYLKALYEHPTHPVVAHFATEAIAVSGLAGQQEKVLNGLRHVSAIPLDFQSKDRIETSLRGA